MSQNENITNERNEISQDEILSSVLKRLSPPAQSSSATVENGNPTGDILSTLLSNPELIAKLPTLLSSIKPILEMFGQSMQASSSAQSAQTVPAAVVSTKTSSPSADSRAALLCAMKPYLSPERQNAIDYIVKLGRLGDILKTL